MLFIGNKCFLLFLLCIKILFLVVFIFCMLVLINLLIFKFDEYINFIIVLLCIVSGFLFFSFNSFVIWLMFKFLGNGLENFGFFIVLVGLW